MDENVKEMFADLEHERWSKWMKYLFTEGKEVPQGFLIDKIYYEWWKKESETPYSELDESQKISDRKEVEKYIQYFNNLETQIKELEEGIEKLMENIRLYFEDRQPEKSELIRLNADVRLRKLIQK